VKICDCNKKLKPIYYVQDDERLFILPSGQLQNDLEIVGNFYTEIPNVVSNSIWVRNFLKNEFGVDSVRIGIGVDSLMFYPREKTAEAITVMAHCRPSTPRRGWEFIKQVLIAVARNRNIGICLYDESDDSFIQANSWVTNHRKVSPHQLSRLLGEAHIFIEGSTIQGWGMQALEAMSSGCTLISTDNKGIDSFGTSGLDCLIVPYGDVALAVSLICKMIDEKDTRYFLSSHARKTAIRFDWDQIVKAWLYYFKSLEV
jgi:glycosyltransferase involved in cell wall biosynthesis